MPSLFTHLLNEYDISTITYVNSPGSFMAIKVAYIFFKTICITKNIEKYKSELKRTELKFSVYNQLQIEALSKLFQQLTEFKEITSIISNSEKRSPEKYKQIAISWTNNFFEMTKLFSKEKYILPIEIKKQYTLIHQNFNTILGFIKSEKELKSNFYTDEFGDVVYEDYERINELTDELKLFNRDIVFEKAINNIEFARKEIENYFEKIT